MGDMAGFTHAGDDRTAAASEADAAGGGEGTIQPGAQRPERCGFDIECAAGRVQRRPVAAGVMFYGIHSEAVFMRVSCTMIAPSPSADRAFRAGVFALRSLPPWMHSKSRI